MSVCAKFVDNQITRVYRWFVFPFIKLGLMSKHVVFRIKGYADHSTTFGGCDFWEWFCEE